MVPLIGRLYWGPRGGFFGENVAPLEKIMVDLCTFLWYNPSTKVPDGHCLGTKIFLRRNLPGEGCYFGWRVWDKNF